MRKLAYRKLEAEEISAELQEFPEWSLREGKLVREYKFPEYQKGLVFASYVGFLADQLNHHPDLVIRYRAVEVSLSTHDVDGISPYDFELISRIDSPAPKD